MMDGWQTRMLGDLLEVQNGYAFDSKWFDPSQGMPLIRIRDLKGGTETETRFSGDYEKRYVVKSGDLLIGMDGEFGCYEWKGSPALLNQRVCRLENFTSKLVPRFLFYGINSYLKAIEDITGYATVKHLSSKQILGITFPIPPLPEQRRIVGILDEAFDGIATAKANAENNLQNARGLFESHLQSVFTQRSKGWVEKSVGEVVAEGALAKPFDGNHGEIHPRKADYTASGVPFIMACDLQNGRVDTEHCTFISRRLADSLRVGFAKDGDVLISHKGTIGRSAIVSTDDDYIMLTPQVTAYRVRDAGKLFNRFIRYYFMSPVFQREMIAGAADGSTRAYIGITKQLSLRFRFPALAEQKRIAAELEVLDRETQLLANLYERKLAALEALKKSLLHQAFIGEL
jgi:type I restriction enzyme S subunit